MTDKDELLLTPKEMKGHWEWVDDGDGYNQRSDWNINTLLEAQLAKARPLIEKQERERIIVWGVESCPHWDNITEKVIKRDCALCWQALKGEK